MNDGYCSFMILRKNQVYDTAEPTCLQKKKSGDGKTLQHMSLDDIIEKYKQCDAKIHDIQDIDLRDLRYGKSLDDPSCLVRWEPLQLTFSVFLRACKFSLRKP